MTIQLVHQILVAERDVTAVTHEGRFVPATPSGPRLLGVRALRASAGLGLRIADRLEQGYRLAA
jgi:hypothetical protein